MRPTVIDLRGIPYDQLRREWQWLATRPEVSRLLCDDDAVWTDLLADIAAHELELIRRSWEAETR